MQQYLDSRLHLEVKMPRDDQDLAKLPDPPPSKPCCVSAALLQEALAGCMLAKSTDNS